MRSLFVLTGWRSTRLFPNEVPESLVTAAGKSGLWEDRMPLIRRLSGVWRAALCQIITSKNQCRKLITSQQPLLLIPISEARRGEFRASLAA